MTAKAVVNVNNIYITKPRGAFVKPGPARALQFILGFPTARLALSTFDRLDPSDRLACGRSKIRDRADKSAPRPPANLPPTSAACAGPHRREQTMTPRHATSTRYAAPSSAPAAGVPRAAPVQRGAPPQP